MPKVPYPYEVNGKLVTGNGSLIPICSLSNRSLLPSLTVYLKIVHLDSMQHGHVGIEILFGPNMIFNIR
jgi:hypothetical protein